MASSAFSRRLVTLAFIGMVSLTGCVSMRPAPVLHLVFFQLHDPAQVEGLQADCDRLLPGIPGVLLFAVGQHIDTGRATVVDDYDLAMLIGFRDEAAYRTYVDHPAHQELVSAWKPRISKLVVRDFLDPSS